MDVEKAFLNAQFDVIIYMKELPGFESSAKRIRVFKLKKALYALKEAALQRYLLLKYRFVSAGSKQTEADPALFTKAQNGLTGTAVVYVDDILAYANQEAVLRLYCDFIHIQIQRKRVPRTHAFRTDNLR